MTLKDILTNIGRRHGVEQLNPMQQAVRRTRAQRIVLLAPTGSGKTLAFTIPLVERLKHDCPNVQAVIIAPSRELVIQIADVIRPVAAPLKTAVLYGAHSMADEVNSLSVTPAIVVATPGRLLDHINRGSIDVSPVQQLVLDEYDKSLELGFHDQMRRIVRRMTHVRYVTLTSATRIAEMPDFIDMSQAATIDYSVKADAPRSRMDIALVNSRSKDKLQTLSDLLAAAGHDKAIVFVNHRESAERVYDYLRKLGYPAGLYHGGLDQMQRELAIDMFNNGTTPILISTDLGSRGLDIDRVDAVIHYHMPPSPESWTHRNGRTARVDATGHVYAILSPGEDIPGYVDYDRKYVPAPSADFLPEPAAVATIYLNSGKKEKLSKSDILGFLVKQAGLESAQVGRITVKDHCAVAAIPRDEADRVLDAFKQARIKGKRVRASIYR